MDKIRVLVVEPLLEPHLSNITESEEVYEEIVGGKYKTQMLDKKTVLVHNENDKEQELVPNRHVGRDIICGKFFIAADNGDGKLASLTDEQAEYYYNRYMDAEVISQQEVRENMLYSGECIGKDEIFVNNINLRLGEIDFKKVVESYKSHEYTEAKELLKMMHEEFCEVYGTNDVDELIDGDDVFIHLPAVMRSRRTGELCVGLVYVDTESSGEHWGTAFAFSNGFISQEDTNRSNPMVEEMQEFGTYDYWYTPDYDGDIHTNRMHAPSEVKELIDYATGQDKQSMKMDGM